MAVTGETTIRLVGLSLIVVGLVARLRDRALPSGVLAFVGFAVAQLPDLLASTAR